MMHNIGMFGSSGALTTKGFEGSGAELPDTFPLQPLLVAQAVSILRTVSTGITTPGDATVLMSALSARSSPRERMPIQHVTGRTRFQVRLPRLPKLRVAAG